MVKRTALYDMDADDEEWLNKLNVFSEMNFISTSPKDNSFELMIDALAFRCSPIDIPCEKAAVNICQDLYGKEVVQALYGYWMKKRKQRKASLLHVFQGHVKKSVAITKLHLRKKRSSVNQVDWEGASV